jgi:hypothetical protein
MRRYILIVVVLVLTSAFAATAVSRATDASEKRGASAAATPPAKQIAALKREVKRLRATIKRLQAANAALSPQGIAAQLDRVKTANDSYRSVDAAKAAGYAAASPCESQAGTGFPFGGMGFHYINGPAAADQTIDAMKPELLLYAPSSSGLELIGVEYFKADADQNLSTDSDRPTLFGRAFDGPMLGHAPGMPIHYDLHVWLYKPNPSGMFAVWNPDVHC